MIRVHPAASRGKISDVNSTVNKTENAGEKGWMNPNHPNQIGMTEEELKMRNGSTGGSIASGAKEKTLKTGQNSRKSHTTLTNPNHMAHE